MGDIESRLNKSAIKKGVTWDTEIDVNVAGNGIYLVNPGAPKLNVAMLEDEQATAFEKNLDVGNINPSDFSMDCDYRWDGLENILLALLFGTSPAPTQQGATAAWLHALSLANSAAGLFGTYATEKGAKIHIVPSFKVMKAAYSFNAGLVRASFSVRGSRVVDTSTVITAMAAVTYPANAHHRAKAFQTVHRMNAQGGADFAGTDVIKPKAFTLEIERSFDSEHVAGSQVILEPIENAKPKVKLTMEFPRMDTVNNAYFADWTAANEKKADIVITGPLIASTYYYYKKFQFPRLIVEDVEYAESKIIPAKISLRAVEADAAPTGMTGLTLPVYAGLMNTRVTSLLA
jgi:hypothetical protein